jgi:hypothetical protein
LRDLGSRKDRNIFKLEIDEIMANNIIKGNRQLSILKILNSLSPRSFSFIISIGKEGFTDPFLKFLDFFNKSVEMS